MRRSILALFVGLTASALAGCGLLERIKDAIPGVPVDSDLIPASEFGEAGAAVQPLVIPSDNNPGTLDETDNCYDLFTNNKEWGAVLKSDSLLRELAPGEDILVLEVEQAQLTATGPIWVAVEITSWEGLPTTDVSECTFEFAPTDSALVYQDNLLACLRAWSDANPLAISAKVCTYGADPTRDADTWELQHKQRLATRNETESGEVKKATVSDDLLANAENLTIENATFCGGGGGNKQATLTYWAEVHAADGTEVIPKFKKVLQIQPGVIYMEGECEIPEYFTTNGNEDVYTGGTQDLGLGLNERAAEIIEALAQGGTASGGYTITGTDLPRRGYVWGKIEGEVTID